MSVVELVFTIIKIVIMLLLCLGLGAALTWNDRRMGAMMQDRFGPNRARLVMPQRLTQVLFAGPALALAAGIAAWGWLTKFPATPAGARSATERILWTSELAVLIAWVTAALMTAWAVKQAKEGPVGTGVVRWLATRVKDPRRVFYVGLVAHVLPLVVAPLGRGTEWAASIKPSLLIGGPLALAAMCAVSGLLAAGVVGPQGFKLRLAGLLHTAADGIKMFFKEDFVPRRGDRLLHSLGPVLALLPPLVVMAVMPFGDVMCFGSDGAGGIDWTRIISVVPRDGVCTSGAVPLMVSDIEVGILFVFAMSGTGILGAAVGGWASDNKYSLLGGLRAAGQLVSYEITLGMTLVGLFMIYSTLRLDDMVRWQGNHAWGIFVQPLAFVLFFMAATAESKRIPFDLPEGESEIVGYFTEYSSMKFGMYFFAEYIEVVTSSAMMVTLFLGGWNLPFLHRDGLTVVFGDTVLLQYEMTHLSVTVLQVLTFFGKVAAMAWLQTVVRWTLPRFRYDQLMRLCWRGLLPLSIVNVVVTGGLVLVTEHASPVVQDVLVIAGDVTQLLVGVAMVVAAVALVLWILKPAAKTKVVVGTSAKLVDAGGTRQAPMQA